MNKGDIELLPFPFTDLTGLKNRPALVLAVGEIDITVAFITSQVKFQEPFDLQIEPLEENGLKRTSLIRIRKLATIAKDLVIGKLGNLTPYELVKVDSNLIKLFNLRLESFSR